MRLLMATTCHRLIIAAAALLFACVIVGADDDFNVQVDIIKHQPCQYQAGVSKWDRKLEFEGGNDQRGPKLTAVVGQQDCYRIGGRVTVFSELSGEFNIYVELRNTASKKQVPESCVNQRADGFGGVGSCLYCNACESLSKNLAVKAELLLNGRQIRCGDGLQAGTYDNLELSFCLPKVDDILLSQGLTKDSFLSLIEAEDGQNLRTMGMFVTVYVFNTNVSQQMQTQMRIEELYRKSKHSFFKDEPLPPDVYWSLPFNMMIKNQRVYVACHKIYGNIHIEQRRRNN